MSMWIRLQEASRETLEEMMLLVQRSQRHLQEIYRPPGFNLGMNLGESAGAGIAEHIHMHVLPRWPGDTNFMTTVAETRVLPEDLREHLAEAAGGVREEQLTR